MEKTLEGMGEPRIKVVALPKDTNSAGNIFGGWIMSQIDLAGAQAARDAGTKVLIYAPHGDFAGAPRGYGHFDTFTDPQLWRTARDWVARLEDSAVKASTTLMMES